MELLCDREASRARSDRRSLLHASVLALQRRRRKRPHCTPAPPTGPTGSTPTSAGGQGWAVQAGTGQGVRVRDRIWGLPPHSPCAHARHGLLCSSISSGRIYRGRRWSERPSASWSCSSSVQLGSSSSAPRCCSYRAPWTGPAQPCGAAPLHFHRAPPAPARALLLSSPPEPILSGPLPGPSSTHTESQNSRGWKGPLWVTQSNPPAEAGSPRAGCTGPCPGGS